MPIECLSLHQLETPFLRCTISTARIEYRALLNKAKRGPLFLFTVSAASVRATSREFPIMRQSAGGLRALPCASGDDRQRPIAAGAFGSHQTFAAAPRSASAKIISTPHYNHSRQPPTVLYQGHEPSTSLREMFAAVTKHGDLKADLCRAVDKRWVVCL